MVNIRNLGYKSCFYLSYIVEFQCFKLKYWKLNYSRIYTCFLIN